MFERRLRGLRLAPVFDGLPAAGQALGVERADVEAGCAPANLKRQALPNGEREQAELLLRVQSVH